MSFTALVAIRSSRRVVWEPKPTYPNLEQWYRVHTDGPWAGKDIADLMRRLEAVVAALDPAKKYALVAIEMS